MLKEFGFVISRKSENPYEFLFELILKIDECCYTQIITYKISCARSCNENVLSYSAFSPDPYGVAGPLHLKKNNHLALRLKIAVTA